LFAFNPYRLIRPLLFELDAETAHHFVLRLLKIGFAPRFGNKIDPVLQTRVRGLDFPNPIGLAAGFDKQAEVIDEMLGFGFGFVEIGSITPRPQPGNPRPRLFRISEAEAIINRLGFNSNGFESCLRAMAAYSDATIRKGRGIIGINIGKNKESADAASDYATGITKFATYADYMTVNVSSPNTPGLRDLQGREQLTDLLRRTVQARDATTKKPPLFVKIAPDQTETQMEDIAEVVTASGADGMIIGNTTVTRPASLPAKSAQEQGGLSGKPLFDLSTQVLAHMYELTQGKMPLIGCGGVSSGADAYAKIRAGASLVQLYTALVYEGPLLIPRIHRDLAALLKRDGFKSVREAVGTGGTST
jgi:dihydroorotate dehydrogenase